MISFNKNQNVQPLFDYYLETDLDNFDDQLVDYSKRYADQDSYEDCRRMKSVSKKYPVEVNQSIKQSCNDELKVYCIEGTPRTISSSSSFCDLREIGSNDVEKSNAKHTYSSVNGDDSPESFQTDLKKNNKSPDNKKEDASPLKEKVDIKEGKSVSFRNSNEISKASTPLMFSRSSSIASLNSFEQHSIVDDRSSVSVFSAITSGLISPSDLPDSPGELMSPALTDTDKSSSPKIDVTKIDCDNDKNIGLSQTDLKETEEIETKDQVSPHTLLSKKKGCIAVDSFKSDRLSEESSEILIEHLEVSNNSLDLDEVFDSPDYEETNSFAVQNDDELNKSLTKVDDESDGEDDILLQQCIQLGMPNNSGDIKSDASIHKKIDYQPHSPNTSSSQVNIEVECSLSDKKEITCDGNEDVLFDRQEEVSAELKETDASMEEVKLKTLDETKSVDDSDEDDELLQRCIQLGMPEDKSNKILKKSEEFVETQYLHHPTNYNSGNDLYLSPIVKSDDDSDADDILLRQCIQLGMPTKSHKDITSGHERIENHNVITKLSASQVQVSNESNSSKQLHCNRSVMQYRLPYDLNEKTNMNAKPMDARKYPSPIKNIPKSMPKKIYPMKADIDSDGEENDELLQHCIQRGMPKEKRGLDSRKFRKPEYNPVNYHSTNDLRDDCPDGISDGDEEDDLLAKCIRAGMPSPKTTNDPQNTLCTSRKLQMSNCFFPPDTNSDVNKKYCHPRLPQNQPYAPVQCNTSWLSNTSFIDVDSMRIYRTEDTPILSPTASTSDLSSLSFNESFLNNSRNSDCSSDSDDDDELLFHCIRSGMPEAKRALA